MERARPGTFSWRSLGLTGSKSTRSLVLVRCNSIPSIASADTSAIVCARHHERRSQAPLPRVSLPHRELEVLAAGAPGNGLNRAPSSGMVMCLPVLGLNELAG